MTHFSRTEYTAGYIFNLQGYSTMPPRNINPIIRLACHTLDSLENMFNYSNPDSMVNLYNNGYVKLDATPELFQNVLEECLFWNRETDGIFNPFNKNLIQGDYKGNIFDPRGLLKSFSMKTVSEVMSAFSLTDHTVTVGDDVLTSSVHTLTEDWIVNIRQPLTLDANKINVMSLNFENSHMRASASSSLETNKGDVWSSQTKTKPCVQDFITTTIIANDIVAADVWSLVSLAEGESVLEKIRQNNLKAVKANSLENVVEGMFLTGDYQYVFTDGFKQYVHTSDC